MNVRSLTRSDVVVLGGALLLIIASFLKQVVNECPDGTPEEACDKINEEAPIGWEADVFPVLSAVFLAGIIGAALIVISHLVLGERKVGSLALDQVGTGLAVSSTLSGLFTLGRDMGDALENGMGAYLGALGGVVVGVGALLNHFVPALQAPLLGGAGAPTYGGQPGYGGGYPGQGQPQQGYGYPGPGGQQPYGAQQGQPQQAQQAPAGGADPNFQPFWFAVPVARPLYAEDGSPNPVAELTPGNWYLAVEQRGQALVAQTQDGRRGVLNDTSGIQRGG